MGTNVQRYKLALFVSHRWENCLIDTGKNVNKSAIVLDRLFGIPIAESFVWRQYLEGTNAINRRNL